MIGATENKSAVPSGDQVDSPSLQRPVGASCSTFLLPVPSGFAVSSASPVSAVTKNAILLPSGDHAGELAPSSSFRTSDPSGRTRLMYPSSSSYFSLLTLEPHPSAVRRPNRLTNTRRSTKIQHTLAVRPYYQDAFPPMRDRLQTETIVLYCKPTAVGRPFGRIVVACIGAG